MIKELKLVSVFILFATLTFGQNVDLNNWKITIPAGQENGKPISVEPPEIFEFENDEVLMPYFYKDESDNSLVFYAYPALSTRNSKYSRTEFREQMEPGSNKVNWTFEDGAKMRGTLSVPKVSQKSNGDYHRVIIMQIHGRLTNEQRDLIGEDDNNAPPILKIYWDEGRIRVKTKVLKDENASDEEILHEHAWGDDKGRNFKEIVGTDKFTLEVNVKKGVMAITLNDRETFYYKGKDIDRWGVFENYFKAGNYFQSRDEGSFAYVKYYDLEVTHDPQKIKIPKDLPIDFSGGFGNNAESGIDLTHWKLETPSGYKASDWKLSNFKNDQFVAPFFYNDSLDGALVMESYPTKGTSKAKYTRNTLREQVQPGSSDVNWTMKEGGVLETEFQMLEMSKDANGKYHRSILLQVDGRTSKKQTEELGLEKPVSMPFIKIYWQDEKLKITRKVLKDPTTVGDALLNKKSWKEEEEVYYKSEVGFEKTKIRIELMRGKVIIQVNDDKPKILRDISVGQWYFENYFTVGNYLQSKDEGCHSKIKFYDLKVTHENKK